MTLITTAMTTEKAKEEFDYAKRQMKVNEDVSACHVTRETWDGKKWVLNERFDIP